MSKIWVAKKWNLDQSKKKNTSLISSIFDGQILKENFHFVQ